MTEVHPHNPPKRSRAAEIVFLITGAVTGLIAAGLLAVGALALWGNAQKDSDGYLSADSQRFAADTHALATENLDLDLDGAESIVSSSDFGKVRVKVAPQSDKPVFVGIARTGEVSAYLRDVSHTTVTDVDYSPFKASYSAHGGDGRPAAPAQQGIWAASARGAGPQTLNWDVADGDWSVVVMNADGSPGVQAEISPGAKVPLLSEIGWSSIGGGTLLLLAAAGMILLGARPPRDRPGTAGAGLAPAAG